jgi:hypothetical protein
MVRVQRKSLSGHGRESHAYKHQALSAKDRSDLQRAKHSAILLLIREKLALKDNFLHAMSDEVKQSLYILCNRIRELIYVERAWKFQMKHVHKVFDNFSDIDCWLRYKTRKQDLPRLLRAFKLDLDEGEYFIASNSMKFITYLHEADL